MALFDEALNIKIKTRWKTAMAPPTPFCYFVIIVHDSNKTRRVEKPERTLS